MFTTVVKVKLVIIFAALIFSGAILLPGASAELPTLQNNVSELAATSEAAGVSSLPTAVTIFELIGQYLLAINALIGVVITCFLIYAGWLWISAEGNEDKIDQAKRIIRGSIIALVIVFAAAVITNFVLKGAISGDFRYGATTEEE